jgi:translation initiation factor IF-3
MSHPELGKKILDQVAESVSGVAKVEAAPKLDGRNMIMVLAPDRRGQVRKHSTNGDESSSTTPDLPATDPPVAAEASGSPDPAPSVAPEPAPAADIPAAT